MKLQRHRNRIVGGVEYNKWVVVVPPKIVDDLGWAEDQELEPKTVGRVLTLRPARKPRTGARTDPRVRRKSNDPDDG